MTEESGYDAPDGSFSYKQEIRDNVVIGVAKGTQGRDASRAQIALLEEARGAGGASFAWLIDTTDLVTLTPEGRKLITTYAMGKDSPMTRIGVVGPNLIVRAVVNLFSRVSKVPAHVFSRNEDALAWFEEEAS